VVRWILGTGLAASLAVEDAKTPLTHLGPFRTQGEAAWLVPCGLVLLTAAVFGYAWIIADILIPRPLLCEIESQHALILGLFVGTGAGCLVTATRKHVRAQVAAFIASIVAAAIIGAALTAMLYGTQCTPFRMFVRQLLVS
jgi:hypothetical protein